MSYYDFTSIEKKQLKRWIDNNIYLTDDDDSKEKYYVLDMFPYPSGTGLHVGHPLGYIASDIFSRYKRMKGFKVLHPIGFDSFGLPAEQHAIQTGKHPAETTEINIKNYKEQLQSIGLSFDWSREFKTSEEQYYKWTQWIFLQIFNSFYDEKENKAKHIDALEIPQGLTDNEREDFINRHRLVYQDKIPVNWCPALGTVLANEEVVNGVSERGGHPVVRKGMRQWMMRITKYAQRLLDDLSILNWPETINLSQKNWIGKSQGAEIDFQLEDESEEVITVYTTRPDTLFGVTYLVLAPEHPLVMKITTSTQKNKIQDYCNQAASKSELERTELEKTKTGVFTGAYAYCPLSKNKIPVWISDYILYSYGTGAVMAVPAGDQRDFEFAKKFELPIVEVITDNGIPSDHLEEAYSGQGIMLNSGDFNGMKSEECFKKIIDLLADKGFGRAKTQFKIRDWVFNRQRYWGEPIPLYHNEEGHVLPALEDELPIILPEVSSYEPTDTGQSPLAKAHDWVDVEHPKYGKVKRETNTMPQWAGSCWYYLRFMDPHNKHGFVSKDRLEKWGSVDLYIGGAEHAVLHLLYARFWHKVLYDLGHVYTKEPFSKLINQGMIQGRSSLVYRIKGKNTYVSAGLKSNHQYDTLHTNIDFVTDDILDIEAFKASRADLKNATFILENGEYKCGVLIEKMSKSLHNVVNPDALISKYGADTFRMYEMFLGPIEQFKPWNTSGIEGVFKFLKKFHALYYNEENAFDLTDEAGSPSAMKIAHQAIKRINDDIERFSFNTCVSHFMIATNELTKLGCKSKEVLMPLVKLIAPFAPFLADEIWESSREKSFLVDAEYPKHNPDLIVENNYEYPISFNGKVRLKVNLPLSLTKKEIEEHILSNEGVKSRIQEKTIKKMIIIPNKIINIVI